MVMVEVVHIYMVLDVQKQVVVVVVLMVEVDILQDVTLIHEIHLLRVLLTGHVDNNNHV
jgi:hypothetical protein